MKQPSTVSIILLLAIAIFGFTALAIELSAAGRFVFRFTGQPCLHAIVEDTNGNGHADEGEQEITVSGLAIQVDDPQGSDSGHYPPGGCFITPTDSNRTIHLHITLPSGYVATSPTDVDVNVFESAHFSDDPPQVTLFVRSVTR